MGRYLPKTYNGNTLSRSDGTDTVSYTWDAENRLVSADDGSTVTTYGYDADGIRVSAETDGEVTMYLVDKNRDYAQVLEERDGSGGLIVSYVYGDDLIRQKRGDAGVPGVRGVRGRFGGHLT
ncbi:RHS repeat-associated core domain-containing pro tein [Desulfonema ishimotonii]|uniref:RHS repeat-associated core domain-containing pro tein n=1 Tax=Desulfonema ishimotonii TaxID=45657 RepID=A0A401FVJ0_9BACT|nr:hypothetical protein [Desulfonema ishimotonii]GBC60979.1 RHS repeat-associated core domain-containing pro tein [Desulfonema ishimotonii]